jgi:hypothetical protein
MSDSSFYRGPAPEPSSINQVQGRDFDRFTIIAWEQQSGGINPTPSADFSPAP